MACFTYSKPKSDCLLSDDLPASFLLQTCWTSVMQVMLIFWFVAEIYSNNALNLWPCVTFYNMLDLFQWATQGSSFYCYWLICINKHDRRFNSLLKITGFSAEDVRQFMSSGMWFCPSKYLEPLTQWHSIRSQKTWVLWNSKCDSLKLSITISAGQWCVGFSSEL